MDVSSTNAAMSPSQVQELAGYLVQKKAIDIEAQNTLQLLQAVPQMAASNPPNLGNNVDIKV